MIIRLEGRGGGEVAEVEILPFKPIPEAVFWGERFFTLYYNGDGEDACEIPFARPIYREAFCYFIPPEIEMPERKEAQE